MSGWLSLIVRVAITVGLMAWAIFGGSGNKTKPGEVQPGEDKWTQFLEVLSEADWSWWLGALAVTLVGQVVAGMRWAALARPLGFDFPHRFFVRRFFEGMFFSLCLPSSIGGDVVKAVRIGIDRLLRGDWQLLVIWCLHAATVLTVVTWSLLDLDGSQPARPPAALAIAITDCP